MFSGEERSVIKTEMPEAEFYEKVQEALEPLGDIDIDDSGGISIGPKSSLVSFLTTLTMSGRVKSTDEGYKVDIQYSVAPSVACWLLAIAGFCFTVFLAAIVVAPLVLDKPNVQKAVETALRDLKDSLAPKKKKASSSSGD